MLRDLTVAKLDGLLQQSGMIPIVLPADVSLANTSVFALARASGLAWVTVRDVLSGTGTVASLERVRLALGLRWSWTSATLPELVGSQLALRRRTRLLSQRAIAQQLGISPQTVVTLETRFRGRIETLRRYLRLLGLREVLAAGGAGKRLVPEGNPPSADMVFTPPMLAARIVAAFSDEIRGRVLEPCRGDGAFYDALPEHVTKDWCELSENRDFFAWSTPVDWIVTNPPWSVFRPFLGHAMRVADNVLFLAPFNHYATKARVGMIRDQGFAMKRVLYVPSPRDWPASGFQLAAVHLQRDWTGPCQFEDLDVHIE